MVTTSNIDNLPDPDVRALQEATAHLRKAIVLLTPPTIRAEQRQRARDAAQRAKEEREKRALIREQNRTRHTHENGPVLSHEDRLSG